MVLSRDTQAENQQAPSKSRTAPGVRLEVKKKKKQEKHSTQDDAAICRSPSGLQAARQGPGGGQEAVRVGRAGAHQRRPQGGARASCRCFGRAGFGAKLPRASSVSKGEGGRASRRAPSGSAQRSPLQSLRPWQDTSWASRREKDLLSSGSIFGARLVICHSSAMMS